MKLSFSTRGWPDLTWQEMIDTADEMGFKGIEIYVWEMAEGSYQCGMMSGTNRNKTKEEIRALAERPLTIEEAKLILKELGIGQGYFIVIPVVQPVSSYRYRIDDAYREKVRKLFG